MSDRSRLLAETDEHAVALIRRLERLERTDRDHEVEWRQAADMARRARGPVVVAIVNGKVAA